MRLKEAFDIVMELAADNILNINEYLDDPALLEEATRQEEAYNIVDNFSARLYKNEYNTI